MLVSANNFNYIKPDREHSNLKREISRDDLHTNAPEELVPDPKEAARKLKLLWILRRQRSFDRSNAATTSVVEGRLPVTGKATVIRNQANR